MNRHAQRARRPLSHQLKRVELPVSEKRLHQDERDEERRDATKPFGPADGNVSVHGHLEEPRLDELGGRDCRQEGTRAPSVGADARTPTCGGGAGRRASGRPARLRGSRRHPPRPGRRADGGVRRGARVRGDFLVARDDRRVGELMAIERGVQARRAPSARRACRFRRCGRRQARGSGRRSRPPPLDARRRRPSAHAPPAPERSGCPARCARPPTTASHRAKGSALRTPKRAPGPPAAAVRLKA